jgi:uncharacterized protein
MRWQPMKRTLLTALVLGATLAFVGAHAPQFAAVRHAAAAELQQASYDKGLLWRIEKPGIAPSYLFGTVHVADKRVLALPDIVRKQLDDAHSFTMEVALDAPNVAALAARMIYTDGRNLPGVAGEELFRKVVPLMAALGVPEELARLFKPWAATLMLAVPQQQPEELLDATLQRAAVQQGKPVHFLETVDDQVAAFEQMPESDQVALLEYTIETRDELPEATEQLLQAYLDRDLGRMWRLSEESVKDRPELKRVNDVFAQRLLFDRNVHMSERMQPWLEEGNAFVAVGALHLYGGQGLLALLARDGYTVTRVY